MKGLRKAVACLLLAASPAIADTFAYTNQWNGGGQGTFQLTNTSAQSLQGWTLEFDWSADVTSLWNGTITSHVGTHYVVTNAAYNATIAAGATVEVGCTANTSVAGVLPTNIILKGASAGGGTGGGTGGGAGGGTGGGTTPSMTIDDASLIVSSSTGGTGGGTSNSGYFGTRGNQIVDASGNAVRIAGVNWFGFETGNHALHGLWSRGYKSMLDQVKSLGFNTLRLPFSNEMLRAGVATNSINFAQNPDLQGLTPIECMDKVITYCGQIGLRVILDRHSAKADNYLSEDVWYVAGDSYYTEQRWIDDWTMLARRYAGNSTVIGADLFNEPKRTASWGTSSAATDWNKAAERCGNAVLSANPDWLIIVEGVEKYNNQTTWWGGNLKGVATHPVVLGVANKLVYSMHDYPASVFAQTWFSDPTYPNNLDDVWYAHWGYIYRNNTAPLLLGEFGSKLATVSDQQWMDKLTDYMDGDFDLNGTKDLAAGELGMSWTYWSLNPNSGDTGGILNDDWTTVNESRMSAIRASLAGSLGGGTTSTNPTQSISFAVRLSAAPASAVSVTWGTKDATAIAGLNYLAGAGTLAFAAGETVKTISVTVPAQRLAAPVQFLVELSGATGASVTDASAVGTLSSVDVGTCEGDGNLDGSVDAADLAEMLLSYGEASVFDLDGSGITDSGDTALLLLNWGPCPGSTGGSGGTTGGSGGTTGGGTTGGSGGTTGGGTTGGATAPVISSSISAAGTVGAQFSYQIVASGSPTSYGATGLPSGLAVNTTSGLISGVPITAATSSVMLSATNAAGTATQALTLTVSPASAPGTFNYAEVLQKSLYFFDAQKSGKLPSGFRVPWRGDSGLADGSDVGVDLTGGYHDAGDHVKFGLPMAASLSLLAWGGIEYGTVYDRTSQTDALRDVIRWGTDFIIKAHPADNVLYGQVGNGSLDHGYWGPAETMNMARPAYAITAAKPGSDLAGESAAALASASILFRTSDPAYSAKLLAHARTLFAFADTYRGKYSDSITDAATYYNSWSGYYDELAWSAAWMYRATGEATYLAKAEAIYASNLSGLPLKWTHNWDDKTYGTTVLLAQLTGKAVYKTAAQNWLDFWTVGYNGAKIATTPGGLAWLDQWGSLRYAANTAFLALVYADRVGDVGTRYRDFARTQVDYMLGKNPAARSYVVGFGVNPPVNPHHRGAHGSWSGSMTTPAASRHILYGALVGGPSAATDTSYVDDRSNYICNEVAMDYNAGFTGAVARLAQDSTDLPLSDFPPASEAGSVDDEFFVEASINQQGSGFTEIRALLNNRSAFPAVGSTHLSFRYFVDLSELFAAGHDQTAVVINANYVQNGTVAPALKVHDATRRIYYVDVSFEGSMVQPGTGSSYWREAQFRMSLKTGVPATAWNASNDPSFSGLGLGNTSVAKTLKIPVYDNGQQIAGVLP